MMMHTIEERGDMHVAIAGLGAIGKVLARALDAGVPGMRLAAVAARGDIRTRDYLGKLHHPVPSLTFEELPAVADTIIECAPAQVLLAIAEPALRAGKTLIVLSVGALLANSHLIALAEQYGGRILVPSGALGGLDAVAALAEGRIGKVKLITHKPLRSLADASWFSERGVNVEELTVPVCVFSGSARGAARDFPANMNVAAALSLAGIGADRTLVEIWADPHARCNTHRIEIEADAANMMLTITNHPSDNPRTSRIAAPSVLALLRKMRAPLRIGY
jgi:aspartate dehydrogenase